jgi:hypothetical protein
MADGIQTIVVTRSHGAFVVQGVGRSARGTKFIIAEKRLKATKPTDPKFKDEVKAAAREILESDA